MRRILRGFVALTVASGILPTSLALAERCDPDKILRSNVEQYNENLVYFLSYLKNLQSQTDKSNSQSFGVSYAGVGLNYADASSLAQFISQQERYVVTKEQSVSVLRSTLSPDSVRAYIACVGNLPPLTMRVSDSALSEPKFPFTVQWSPGYRAKSNQMELKVINGTIDGKTEKKVTIQPQDQADFVISRDGNGSKTLIISANVDGKSSDPVFMPGFPSIRNKITTEIRAAVE